MTIAAWQFVESSLIDLYYIAVRAKNYPAVAASFHTPTNFRVRLDMTNEAVSRSIADKALLAKWAKLYDRAVEKAKRRNKLAHVIVLFDPKKQKPNKQLFLAPHLNDPRHDQNLEQGKIITQPELEAMMRVFEKLRSDIDAFRQHLFAQP